jgi:Tat protein secretion system quality control protein TatD with DNase activity
MAPYLSIMANKYFEKQFELAYATNSSMFLHMHAAAAGFCEIVERNKVGQFALFVDERTTQCWQFKFCFIIFVLGAL